MKTLTYHLSFCIYPEWCNCMLYNVHI